jgi:hypothetical protein
MKGSDSWLNSILHRASTQTHLSLSKGHSVYLPTLSLVQNQPSVTTLGPTVSLVSTVSAPCTALSSRQLALTFIGTADAELLLLVFGRVKVDVSSGMSDDVSALR